MSDDDDIPDLEDFSEQLGKIRKNRGETNDHIPSEIKVNVIDNNIKNQNTNKVNIPITTIQEEKKKEEPKTENNPKNEEKKPKKDDDDDFGKGFRRGFFRRQNKQQNKTEPKKNSPPKVNNNNTTKINNNNNNNKNNIEDLTYIKSSPGTTTKTNTMNSFSENLKESEKNSSINHSLLNNIVDNKQQWLNQELLMKIAQKPNLMKAFMDPRFAEVIKEMQNNPKECMLKYGNNPEFSNFIKEFSSIMGEHFNNLAKNPMSTNPNYYNDDVQNIINDPKIKPILDKLQIEGKIDIEEIQRDSYVASKFKVLIDKGILNIKKMD